MWQLPVLAARGPGQPLHSCRGDGEAADAGAAPAGRPEASAGKAGLGKTPPFLGVLPGGSTCIFLCSFGFIFLKAFLFHLRKELFSTSICMFVFTGSRTENESGREPPG